LKRKRVAILGATGMGVGRKYGKAIRSRTGLQISPEVAEMW
jgi:hypothetical protein